MPEKFQKSRWSGSPLVKVAQNLAVKLFWNFKNKLLSGRRSRQFEFLGQVNSMFANSENKSRLPIVLFFNFYSSIITQLSFMPRNDFFRL